MKDLISATVLALVCIGFWAAIPVFAVIAGTGMAILFLKYIIKMSNEHDEDNQNTN